MDAEVSVRFAGTLLAVTRIPRGSGYRIGSAPDVDLAVDIAPLTSFPLIAATERGFVVRCPAGVPAVEYAGDRSITVTESEIALAPGTRLDLAFGRVMISIAGLTIAHTPLERPRFERRPHIFAAVSLAAHLAMLIVALACADLDDITMPAVSFAPERKPTSIARFPSEEQKAVRRLFSPNRKRVRAPITVEPPTDTPRGRAIQQARHAGFLDAAGLAAGIARLVGKADLAAELDKVGPIYDEDAAMAKGFGGSERKWGDAQLSGSEKTGRYATVSQGHAAGEFYDIGGGSTRANVSVVLCDGAACAASDAVQSELEKKREQIEDCYERHAPKTPKGNVLLTFAIDKDGRAAKVRVSGLFGVGTCVAHIAKHVQFPSGEEQVKYSLAFSRS